MSYPVLRIHRDRILHNAESVTRLLKGQGIDWFGVTKVVCAEPSVASAMLAGGAMGLADSRVSNLERLREAGFDCPMMLLRLPMPGEAARVVAAADLSLVSEAETLRALDSASASMGRRHGVVVMVDVGDLREGVWPPEEGVALAALVDETMQNLELVGLGVNLACYGGVIPDRTNMGRFAAVVRATRERLGRDLKIVSGGNSSGLPLALEGTAQGGTRGIPGEVNSFRVGETVILGRNVIDRSPFPGTRQDAVEVVAEIVELKVKPSVPIGDRGQDAFGMVTAFPERGPRLRAILAMGRQDTVPENLTPCLSGAEILGASSDHLIVDLTGTLPPGTDLAAGTVPTGCPVTVGGTLAFWPGYGALLASATSSYVGREICND